MTGIYMRTRREARYKRVGVQIGPGMFNGVPQTEQQMAAHRAYNLVLANQAHRIYVEVITRPLPERDIIPK